MSLKDYEDNLTALKVPFLNTPGIKIIKLGENNLNYLRNLALEIISHNEIFFKQLKVVNITILDTHTPMHFSLPRGELFFSKGLITKYIKNESMLAGIIAYELIRSEKLIYPKIQIVPTGFILMERMILFHRLTLEEKIELHKWAHHVATRTGFDGEYYLSWLQTQNRNTADFIFMIGDANQITREESLFKAFLIKRNIEESTPVRRSTSKNFYTFVNKLRDVI